MQRVTVTEIEMGGILPELRVFSRLDCVDYTRQRGVS